MNREIRFIKSFFFLSLIFLFILFGFLFLRDIRHEKDNIELLALEQAKANYEKDLAYRRWNALHGGVYVPITDSMQPNKYLDVENREITSTSGKKYTLVNPAYMTRQTHELSYAQYGVKGHITSLNPINPKNMADSWENKALKSFNSKLAEYYEVDTLEGELYLRYMKSMIVENSCLKCHGKQGYKVGDVRGGISVAVPLKNFEYAKSENFRYHIKVYSAIYILCIIILIPIYRYLRKEIKKRVESQKLIEESRTRFKQLSDLAFEGIIIHNNGEVVDANRALTTMCGLNKNELIGKNITDLFANNKHKETFAEHIKNELTEPFEAEIIRTSGENISIEVNSKWISKKNKNLRVTSLRDISEKKNFQRKLNSTMMKTEEAERERYAKELHDGLGPILSTCKVYFRTLHSIKDESKRELHIKRINELLEDALLSIREISNNLSPHILRNYGLSSALDSFIEKLSQVTDTKFIIQSEYQKPLPEIYEFTLYRLLVELINNSIKYSKAKEIKIKLMQDKEYLEIKYSDNGIGFDYEEVKQKGNGFGLLNLEQRIKEIDGDYSYKSTPNNGVKVEILIKLPDQNSLQPRITL